MQKILINLLPIEVKASQIKEKKFFKIQAISIACILVLAFFASATVALGVLQSQKVKNTQDDLAVVESQVTTFQQAESSLTALKDRLTQIEKLQGDPSIQRTLYTLINAITPLGITIQTVSIDANGVINLSVTGANGQAVDTYLNDLLSSEKNENKIKIISIQNLVRTKDGSFRMNLLIETKPKSTEIVEVPK